MSLKLNADLFRTEKKKKVKFGQKRGNSFKSKAVALSIS